MDPEEEADLDWQKEEAFSWLHYFAKEELDWWRFS